LKATINLILFLNNESETDFYFTCSQNETIAVPSVNLTMKGGDDYYVTDPIVVVVSEVGAQNIFPILCYLIILNLHSLISSLWHAEGRKLFLFGNPQE